MATHTILWTAVPNGRDGDRPKLSIVVTFQLHPDIAGAPPTASPLVFNWPAWIAARPPKFTVLSRTPTENQGTALALGNTMSWPPDLDGSPSGALWPAGWRAFLRDAVLSPFAPFANPGAPLSYPVDTNARRLDRIYARGVAGDILPVAPGQPPKDPELDDLRQLGSTIRSRPPDAFAGIWTSSTGYGYRFLTHPHALRAAATPGYDVIEPIDTEDGGDHAATLAGARFYAAHAVAHKPFNRITPVNRSTNRQPADPPKSRTVGELISSLGSYPELLRRFALVLDLTLPADISALDPAVAPVDRFLKIAIADDEWPPNDPAFWQVWNQSPTGPVAETVVHRSPWTHVDLENFRPYVIDPAPGEAPTVPGRAFRFGLLDAGRREQPGSLSLSQLDIESALLTIAGQQDAVRPAPRSAGVTIARANQDDIVSRKVSQALTLAGSDLDQAELHAGDLNRGFRIDVWTSGTSQWRSLHQRNVQVALVDGSLPDETDRSRPITGGEGFLHLSLATPVDDGEAVENQPIFPQDQVSNSAPPIVAEAIGRWLGWSLTVPRLEPAVDPMTGLPVDTQTGSTVGALQIDQFVVDDSLPRLRFGTGYQLRVRTVDLAGNSHPTVDIDEVLGTGASEIQRLTLPRRTDIEADHDQNGQPIYVYRRHEPVTSPVLVPRAKLEFRDDGGNLTLQDRIDRLVIRADADDTGHADPAAYLALHPAYQDVSTRFLLPPQIDFTLAEWHGAIDAALASGGDRDAVRRAILSRLDAELSVFEPDETLSVPYLPDPLANGLAFWRAGDDRAFGLYPYLVSPGWPELQGIRLDLTASDRYVAPTWDAATGRLKVGLPPGGEAEFRVSSSLRAEEVLNLLALWKTFERYLNSTNTSDVATVFVGLSEEDRHLLHSRFETRKDIAVSGGIRVLTPSISVKLVYAVQRPLQALDLGTWNLEPRTEGQTDARILAMIGLHGLTTGRLDLSAEWNEPLDHGKTPTSGDAVTRPIEIPQTSVAHRRQLRSQTLPAAAISNLALDGAEASWEERNLLQLTRSGVKYGGGQAAVFFDLSGSSISEATSGGLFSHEFNDTKRRSVTYSVVATTRFQDDFPTTIAADPANITRSATTNKIFIPSTARPPAPELMDVVPVFRWQKTAPNAQSRLRVRTGGVRVYLRRPWYVTGEGELLGVVLYPGAGFPQGDLSLDQSWQHVTRWGRDPIWHQDPTFSAGLPDRPVWSSFPKASTADGIGEGTLVTVPNLDPSVQFAIAGHTVQYSEKRDLWFADIAVDAGDAYFPFIQLALARFQPVSIDDHQCSTVVIAEPVQFVPRREVLLNSDPNDPNRLTITLSGAARGLAVGPTGQSLTTALETNSVEFRVEHRMPGTSDELGWEAANLAESIVPVEANDPNVLYQASLLLPENRTPNEYRIVLEESEHIAADDVNGGYTAKPRLVFLDTIEV